MSVPNGPCYIDKDVLTTPKNGTEVFVDYWWWEKDGKILDYVLGGLHYPQSNINEDVMRHMEASGHTLYVGHTPVKLPLAFYPSRNGM